MNERIREIAMSVQCERHWTEQDIEKFAELIVRECGAVAYKAYWSNPETIRGRHIEEKIREHFGVEE